MNIVDTAIETLRERFRLQTESRLRGHGFAFQDGYRAAMQDAAIEIEHCLRGLSTFEGRDLPSPKDCRQPVWCIPMRWRDESLLIEQGSAVSPFSFQPRLELQRLETARGQWSWLVRPQVWTP